MRARLTLIFTIFFIVSLTNNVEAADAEGWFGFGVDVDGSGRFWNPVVEKMTINRIEPDSPAERSKLALGYTIEEIDGHPVPGTRAQDLQPLLTRHPGDSIHMLLTTPDGMLEVVLQAIINPGSQ